MQAIIINEELVIPLDTKGVIGAFSIQRLMIIELNDLDWFLQIEITYEMATYNPEEQQYDHQEDELRKLVEIICICRITED